MTVLSSVVTALVDHCSSLGVFSQVATCDTVYAPATQSAPSVTVTVASVRPISGGMSFTSSVLSARIRITVPMLGPISDATVDATLLDATQQLVDSMSQDFTLDGLCRSVDIRGIYGSPISIDFGYVSIDSTTYRASTLIIPIIVDDVWTEAP